jgi:hypothetical protein
MATPELIFTHDFAEATRLCAAGYEPIECAFGQHGSVLGPLALDHHGTESHREGVAIRACRDHYGARVSDPRFVVTGTPDADAVLAIVALAALVPQSKLTPEFYELVNAHDTDPIGHDLLGTEPGERLAWFNQREKLFQNVDGFGKAIGHMVHLLTHGLSAADRAAVHKADRGRRRRALDGVQMRLDARGEPLPVPEDFVKLPVCRGEAAVAGAARVLVVHSTVWGFDAWYRLAPVVVSYAERMAKVTVGCPDTDTADRIFGPGGLERVWPSLGVGWGGRGTIGGSPRGQRLSIREAEATARKILPLLLPSS